MDQNLAAGCRRKMAGPVPVDTFLVHQTIRIAWCAVHSMPTAWPISCRTVCSWTCSQGVFPRIQLARIEAGRIRNNRIFNPSITIRVKHAVISSGFIFLSPPQRRCFPIRGPCGRRQAHYCRRHSGLRCYCPFYPVDWCRFLCKNLPPDSAAPADQGTQPSNRNCPAIPHRLQRPVFEISSLIYGRLKK